MLWLLTPSTLPAPVAADGICGLATQVTLREGAVGVWGVLWRGGLGIILMDTGGGGGSSVLLLELLMLLLMLLLLLLLLLPLLLWLLWW